MLLRHLQLIPLLTTRLRRLCCMTAFHYWTSLPNAGKNWLINAKKDKKSGRRLARLCVLSVRNANKRNKCFFKNVFASKLRVCVATNSSTLVWSEVASSSTKSICGKPTKSGMILSKARTVVESMKLNYCCNKSLHTSRNAPPTSDSQTCKRKIYLMATNTIAPSMRIHSVSHPCLLSRKLNNN